MCKLTAPGKRWERGAGSIQREHTAKLRPWDDAGNFLLQPEFIRFPNWGSGPSDGPEGNMIDGDKSIVV